MKYNLSDEEIMGNDKTFLKRRSNGLMLSDEDINILQDNGIDYLKYNNLRELIFEISSLLEENYNSELEQLSVKLGEYNYYYYTNK